MAHESIRCHHYHVCKLRPLESARTQMTRDQAVCSAALDLLKTLFRILKYEAYQRGLAELKGRRQLSNLNSTFYPHSACIDRAGFNRNLNVQCPPRE